MKRATVWLNSAQDESPDLIGFIAEANSDAAARVTGTDETVIPGLPCFVAYAPDDQPGRNRVAVLHIIHGARDWPEDGWPE